MSRPSSLHHRDTDNDFSLPLFQSHPPPTLAYHPPAPPSQPSLSPHLPPPTTQHSHQHQHHLSLNPPRQQQQHRAHRLSLSVHTQQSPQSPAIATGYSPTGYPAAAGNGHHQASNNRQSLHFPASFASPYDDAMPQQSQLHGGSALSNLARSASLGTGRRKDPFKYAADDVESGMAGDRSAGSVGYAQPGDSNLAPTYRDTDVVMSPGRPGYTGPTSSMPPPPVPMPQARVNMSSPSKTTPSHSQSQNSSSAPSNPYVPHRGSGGEHEAWQSYRRSSHHSSSDGLSLSTSPLPNSPAAASAHHQPAQSGMSPYDPSPAASDHGFLTPHGSHKVLPPGSPRQGNAQPSSSPSHGYRSSSTHRQSFAASQPVTPSDRYHPTFGGYGSSSRPPSSSKQGFRTVRGPEDLKPRVNPHPQGRRADPNVPGAYLSPLKCLTSQLPQTYTLCNPTFRYETTDNPRRVLTKPSKPVYNDGADNEDWDYILYVNDVLGGDHGGDRYLILDVLGQGTFGQVVKCQNMRTHDICAVKVVKNKPAYLNQSKMEVAILQLLNRDHDPRDEHHILRLQDSFTHKNHLCLVFECLSSNLYELIKQNQFKGLSLQLVRVFTQQLLDCLAVLKDARLIHCDLKPENILLKSLQSPSIKVIDFGSACHELQTVYTYIQSRFYRSPEVLLGLPYSTSIDMWSLGCIVVELFLGLPIFPGTSEYNQVSRIVDMMGLPPQHLLEVGKQTNEFFNFVGVDAHGHKQYKLKPMDQYASEHRTKEQPSKQYFKQTKLPDIINEYPLPKKNTKQADIDREMQQRKAFINFVEGLLNLDPIKRWSPQQAAKHPFITGEKYTGPFEPPLGATKRRSNTTGSSVTTPSSSSSATSTTAATSTSATATTPSKKYGGLVQSPTSGRGQRVYSDAAAYNHQLAQHQYQTAQAAAAQNTVRPGPFSPGYEPQQSSYNKPRVASHQLPLPSSWQQQQQQQAAQQAYAQPLAPPQQQQQTQQGHHRLPSQQMGSSHVMRQNVPVINAPTNPPPNSYYPASRNRANTINQMDTIPAALARLTNLGAPDPSGNRTSLTPVLHREDMVEAWERRQQGGHKPSSLHNAHYAQLEYLQEQAELVNMGQSYVMPGQYGHGAHPGAAAAAAAAQAQVQHGGHHRGSQSFSGVQGYQQHPAMVDYGRQRGGGGGAAGEYDPPSATKSRNYLPTYPPPVATHELEPGMIMYSSPNAQAAYQGYSPGHASRASYSGPYRPPAAAYPQGQPQQPVTPTRQRYPPQGYQ